MTISVSGNKFDPQIFSSRKLIAVVDELQGEQPDALWQTITDKAIDELTRRGHYLTELAQRGLIRHRPNR